MRYSLQTLSAIFFTAIALLYMAIALLLFFGMWKIGVVCLLFSFVLIFEGFYTKPIAIARN